MFPIGSVAYMNYKLDMREGRRGTDIPITIGILVADMNRTFVRDNILTMLDSLNTDSGEMIDFYMPGYLEDVVYKQILRSKGLQDNKYVPGLFVRPLKVIVDNNIFDVTYMEDKRYFFSSVLFNEFIRMLGGHGIRTTGETQLILVPYVKNRLEYHKAVVFNLEEDYRQNRIPEIKSFFDSIIEIAKTTTDASEFAKTIHRNQRNSEITQYVKEKLKDGFFNFLISKIGF